MSTKIILLALLLLLAAAAGRVGAQPVATNKAAESETDIASDRLDYYNNSRQLIYTSNVVVSNASVTLHCDRLTVDLPPEGQNQPTNILAENNVVIDYVDKGMTSHLTAAKAVYVYNVVGTVTNQWDITFTGTPDHPPMVVNPQFTVTSEPLIRDLATGQYHFFHEKIIYKQSATNAPNGTPLNLFK